MGNPLRRDKLLQTNKLETGVPSVCLRCSRYRARKRKKAVVQLARTEGLRPHTLQSLKKVFAIKDQLAELLYISLDIAVITSTNMQNACAGQLHSAHH